MKTPIILCADDYALTPGISRGIRELAGQRRLSATSAMTVSPYWETEGRILRDLMPSLGGRFTVGLHFTLTDLKPLTNMPNLAPQGIFPKLGDLLGRAIMRRILVDEIAHELNAQIDRFEAVMGELPQYLDGHHHVHQLPIVRDVVLSVAGQRLGPDIFLRFGDEPASGIVRRGVSVARALAIAQLGRKFATRARAAGLRGNTGFRGVRDFSAAENVAHLFDAYLTGPQPNMMIMCHPGIDEPAPGIDDEIHARRPEEFAFLRSDAFADLMARRNVTLIAPGGTS